MSSKLFTVVTKFLGIDEMTQPMNKIGNRGMVMLNKLNMGFGAVGKGMKAFEKSKVGQVVDVLGTYGSVGALTGGLAKAIHIGVDFENTMVSAASKFGDGIAMNSEKYKALEKSARAVGKATKYSASQAAQSLEMMAMAGWNADDSMASLKTMLNFATASKTDLAQTAEITTKLFAAFSLDKDKDNKELDSAGKAQNMQRFADVLSMATKKASINTIDMFETFKQVGPVSVAVGASFEEVTSLTTLLAKHAIVGGNAATVLKNAYGSLSGPVGAAAKTIADLNLNVKKSDGTLKSLPDILNDITKAFDAKGWKKGDTRRAAAIKDIFGQEAFSGILALMQEGKVKIDELTKELENSGGTVDKLAAAINASIGGNFDSMNSALEDLGISVFKIVEGPLKGLLSTVKDNSLAFSDWLTGMNKFGLLTDAASLVINLAKVFLVYKGVMIASAAVTRTWAVAQTALNLAMSLNPVGAGTMAVIKFITVLTTIVGVIWTFRHAIVGAVASFVKLFTHIPFIGDWAKGAAESMQKYADEAKEDADKEEKATDENSKAKDEAAKKDLDNLQEKTDKLKNRNEELTKGAEALNAPADAVEKAKADVAAKQASGELSSKPSVQISTPETRAAQNRANVVGDNASAGGGVNLVKVEVWPKEGTEAAITQSNPSGGNVSLRRTVQ